ncbi:MAG: hypothetical protein D3916_09835 [Candidatus Electrothrix sp. MAN1_4]|nr:hypothetical protein [Candidatus Electrothrix sp. MAN1_4]
MTLLVETNEEISQPASGGMGAAGIGDKLKAYFIKETDETFADAMRVISYTSNALLKEVKEIDEAPANAEVQFGIKITGSGKSMLASVGAESTFTIKLTWQKTD